MSGCCLPYKQKQSFTTETFPDKVAYELKIQSTKTRYPTKISFKIERLNKKGIFHMVLLTSRVK